jgi:hypothetical protein
LALLTQLQLAVAVAILPLAQSHPLAAVVVPPTAGLLVVLAGLAAATDTAGLLGQEIRQRLAHLKVITEAIPEERLVAAAVLVLLVLAQVAVMERHLVFLAAA